MWSLTPTCILFPCSSFTKLPHLAGTEQNLLLAKKIQTQWKKFGLDSAKLVHYDVLLSYPSETNVNYISVMDEHGIEVMWNYWYSLYLVTPVYVNWDIGSSKNRNLVIVQWNSYFLEELISCKLIIQCLLC